MHVVFRHVEKINFTFEIMSSVYTLVKELHSQAVELQSYADISTLSIQSHTSYTLCMHVSGLAAPPCCSHPSVQQIKTRIHMFDFIFETRCKKKTTKQIDKAQTKSQAG